ncbi:MAG: glycine oxidase ThiO [Planctomycetaceae bacterium]|nr:glycine oxidase ThiO [Planctomycetaceae bacterium]
MALDDVLVVGGGVVGLTTALELAEKNVRVRVIDRGFVGQEASWAGAGMIPPGEIHLENNAYQEMARQSYKLWPSLSENLFDLSGIHNEYMQCGAVILSEDSSECDSEQQCWSKQGVETKRIASSDLAGYQISESMSERNAYLLAGQSQVRNPRHLQALKHACVRLGVRITEHQRVRALETQGKKIQAVVTDLGRYSADRVLFAAGAWSQELGRLLQVSVPVTPIRGQIVLLNTPGQLKQIIEQGKRYLVPRADGRLLIGATEERVGFDRRNTAQAVGGLIQFATQLVPSLENAEVERTWVGFRPGSPDNLPLLGRAVPWENAFVATGLYRAGLSLSPITGRLMRQLILGESPEISLSDFSVTRFSE